MSFESKLRTTIHNFMVIFPNVSKIITKYIKGTFNYKPVINKLKIFTYIDGYRNAL